MLYFNLEPMKRNVCGYNLTSLVCNLCFKVCVVSSYLMPIIWAMTFPKPMKMALVRVKKPLSSFGELSVRYMSWTFRPRPVETNKMSRGGERKEMTIENRTLVLQISLTYQRCIHKEIFPAESSQRTSTCDWRPWPRRQQPPQRCWSEEPFFYKIKERFNCMRFKAPCFILY